MTMTQSAACASDVCFAPSRCTGKERDQESGNDHFDARYYASSMGRFLSPDPGLWPIDDPQSFNMYAYGLNNPLRYVDEEGEAAKDRVNAANELVNRNPPIPYVWGGKCARTGLDCSGLVQNVFDADPDNYINMHTNAAGQANARLRSSAARQTETPASRQTFRPEYR